jgi:biotin operon repressor
MAQAQTAKRKPNANTRKGQVLIALKGGRWTPGYELSTAAVGGSEGLRRLRELREDGYTIEHRTHKGVDQYRLVRS